MTQRDVTALPRTNGGPGDRAIQRAFKEKDKPHHAAQEIDRLRVALRKIEVKASVNGSAFDEIAELAREALR